MLQSITKNMLKSNYLKYKDFFNEHFHYYHIML